MNYLSVENLAKSFDENILFENLTFGLAQGQKAALVGVNGSGKSTLLKIIAGQESQDKGQVSVRKDLKISYLPQNPEFTPGLTVLQSIFDHDSEELGLIKEYELELLRSQLYPEKENQLPELIEKMNQLNVWEYEHQVKELLGKLGIEDFEKKIEQLSGGQLKRVAIAQSLVIKPDLLILDEPTNHLDIDIIEWLESYLSLQNMTLLLVTHDRYFLDKVSNTILEISSAGVKSYAGNYGEYLNKKEQEQSELNQQVSKAKNLFKKELEWIRRQPKARGTKAKYRVDAFDDIKKTAHQKTTEDKLEINLSNQRQGKKILELHHLGFSYDSKIILKDFSYTFKRKDRIGIIGKNGAGKSTLLNIILGLIRPNSGKIEVGQTTNFGYYSQEHYEFDPNQKVIDSVLEIAEFIKLDDGNQISASQLLNQFLFPPAKQHQLIAKLSGGERRRLQLLRTLISNPNFLVFDEPTNDLDIMTLNVLEDYLANYSGCLMIVSHDRYFMDRLVDHLFVMEGSGIIRDFPGNYTDFRSSAIFKSTDDLKNESKDKAEGKQKSKSKEVQNKLSYNEKREFEELTNDLPKLELTKTKLENELNSLTDFEELNKVSLKLKELSQEIDEKEMRWLELSERNEK